MSDVWSTMAGECGEGEGLHLTTADHAVLELVDPVSGAPVALEDGASGELVWTHLRREASPLLRYRSGDLGRVWTAPCACGRDDAADPRSTAAATTCCACRRSTSIRRRSPRCWPRTRGSAATASWPRAIPIVAAARVFVEAPPEVDPGASPTGCARRCARASPSHRLAPGALPVAEHKTRIVHRTARGDTLPPAVETLRREDAR